MGSASLSYQGHRYPVEIISHCVGLYYRFPPSFREVEELMPERGIVVSYETVRRWCAKSGQTYAGALRRRQPRPGDEWHLDEVFIKINGEQKYPWRGVGQGQATGEPAGGPLGEHGPGTGRDRRGALGAQGEDAAFGGQFDAGAVHARQVELQIQRVVVTPGVHRNDGRGRVGSGARQLVHEPVEITQSAGTRKHFPFLPSLAGRPPTGTGVRCLPLIHIANRNLLDKYALG